MVLAIVVVNQSTTERPPLQLKLSTRRSLFQPTLRQSQSMEVETGTKPWLTEALDAMQARGECAPAKRERLLRAAEADGAKFGVKPLEEVGGESHPKDSPFPYPSTRNTASSSASRWSFCARSTGKCSPGGTAWTARLPL